MCLESILSTDYPNFEGQKIGRYRRKGMFYLSPEYSLFSSAGTATAASLKRWHINLP
jgi:hypothetical protein